MFVLKRVLIRNRFAALPAAIALTLFLFGSASAQNPITWQLKATKPVNSVRPGQKFNVKATATIQDGWHLYAPDQPSGGPTPTNITVPVGQPFKLAGKIRTPSPNTAFDQNFGIETKFFTGRGDFVLPIAVAADAQPGKSQLRVEIYFQTCNDRICLPAKNVKLEIPVEITANTSAGPASPQDATRTSASRSNTGTSQEGKAVELRQGPSAGPTPLGPVVDSVTSTLPRQAAGSTNNPGDQSGQSLVPGVSAAPGVPVKAATHSLLSFIWLAMVMGALSLLTPCVFPMIPITVSYFTSHASERRSRALRNALVYGLGIVLTFSGLGLALALLFGAAGVNRLAASPWMNLLITAIFLGFALSLFGSWLIRAPGWLINRLDRIGRRNGTGEVAATLSMGFVFTLTSFTCTAPFVGTLLVTASQGNWRWPLAGMLAFSTVFAIPFVLFALAPQLMARLPKSGGWLGSVKIVMGFIEIAAAMKFLSNADLIWGWGVFTRPVVLAVWMATALLVVLYLLGIFRMAEDAPSKGVTGFRAVLAVASLAIAVWLGTGLLGGNMGELESFLPPTIDAVAGQARGNATIADATDSANSRLDDSDSRRAAIGASNPNPTWIVNDLDSAMTEAARTGRPVLIDFTGYTCTNCRWMESEMFTRPEVKSQMQRFVLARLYTDGAGEKYERQQKLENDRFGTVALPYYAIVDSRGNTLATFPGLTRDPSEFLRFLSRGNG